MSTAFEFPLGQYQVGQQTIFGTATDVNESLLGKRCESQCLDRRVTTPNQEPSQISAGTIISKIVRNESGGNLIPGYAAKLSVAADGATGAHDVAGYGTSIANHPCYLIDPFIKESVIPDKALFHIILCGVAQFICGEALAKGKLIVPGTGGKWVEATPDADGSTIEERWAASGKVITATASNGDRGWALIFGNLMY